MKSIIIQHSLPSHRPETGAKKPQTSSSRHGCLCGTHISERYSHAAQQHNREGSPGKPCADIHLAGDDLANNHPFYLLSDLLSQTFPNQTVAPKPRAVNPFLCARPVRRRHRSTETGALHEQPPLPVGHRHQRAVHALQDLARGAAADDELLAVVGVFVPL